MAPMQVSMRASAATLAVLGLLAASFAGGASGAGSPETSPRFRSVSGRTGSTTGTVDGVLGPRTERAVVRFQRRAGLSADGVLGPRTRKAFGRYGRRAPLGRTGPGDRHPRLGRRRAAVRARLARLSVGGLRRRARRAHRHGAAEVPALGRARPGRNRRPVDVRGAPRGRCRARRSSSWLQSPAPMATCSGRAGNRFHAGIDIPAVQGDARRAQPQPGASSSQPRATGSGKLVVLDHGNGVRTRYAHLSRITRPRRPVREGPRHGRPRRRDGRGDRPAPALRGARARGQRGSIVRALARTMPSPRRQPWARPRGSARPAGGPSSTYVARRRAPPHPPHDDQKIIERTSPMMPITIRITPIASRSSPATACRLPRRELPRLRSVAN